MTVFLVLAGTVWVKSAAMSRIEHPLRGALGLFAGYDVHLLDAEVRRGFVADPAMVILLDHFDLDLVVDWKVSELACRKSRLDTCSNIWKRVSSREANGIHVPCLLWSLVWLLSYRRAVPGCVTNKQHFNSR